jgi:hypothetical protein
VGRAQNLDRAERTFFEFLGTALPLNQWRQNSLVALTAAAIWHMT